MPVMAAIVPAPVLASASESLFSQVVPWLAVLVVLVLVGGVAILALRRSLQGGLDDSDAEGFTLHGLRRLHAEGELSDEEFAQAKDAMIGRMKARVTDDPDEADADDADAGPIKPPSPGA